jgi:hypothetical protein
VSVLNGTAVGAELKRLGRKLVSALAGPFWAHRTGITTSSVGAIVLAFCATYPLAPLVREVLIEAALAGFAVVRIEFGRLRPTVE